MRWSNEEIVSISEDARDGIEQAIRELDGCEIFKDLKEALEEDLRELNYIAEPYQEAYDREYEEEMQMRNEEFERSRI